MIAHAFARRCTTRAAFAHGLRGPRHSGPILNHCDAIDCELSTDFVGKPVDIRQIRRVTS
ncbi:hypothetical protein BCEN4_1150020 [Burkholderia cenocepacia]|nr:hypothetical protein BCEN4_1150020 [Burkholderia cenocepacia]